jgi:site-specific recombinase XerD
VNKILEKFKEGMLSEDISYNSIRNYISDIRNFYKWYQEIDFSEDLNKMTFYHLNAYKDHMIGNKRKKTSSINRSIQSLKNFCQFLIKRKLIKTNPAEKIRFLKSTKRMQPQALSKQYIHKLLSVTSHSSHGTQKRNYAIIQIMLQTGIRVSELTNLELRDLKIYDRSGEIRIVNAKGGKERTIPLNNIARRALKSYLGKRLMDSKNVAFLSKRDQKLTTRAVQKVISNLGKKANIGEISPHILRHTFAINYLRSNPQCLVELSGLLGHESLDTTSIYTVASKERLASTIEKAGVYVNE